jgi:hypothetical protein
VKALLVRIHHAQSLGHPTTRTSNHPRDDGRRSHTSHVGR